MKVTPGHSHSPSPQWQGLFANIAAFGENGLVSTTRAILEHGHQRTYELERGYHSPHAWRWLLVMAFSSSWPKALKSDLEGQRFGVLCPGGDIDSSP